MFAQSEIGKCIKFNESGQVKQNLKKKLLKSNIKVVLDRHDKMLNESVILLTAIGLSSISINFSHLIDRPARTKQLRL